MKIFAGFISKLGENRNALLFSILSLSAIVAIWQMLPSFFVSPKSLPLPRIVMEEAWKLILSGELFKHIAASLQRVLVGFAFGSLVGVIVGTLVGRIKLFRNLLDPVIEVIRPISAVAMIPLALIWFGIAETSRYFIIFCASVFNVLINTAAGVTATPQIRDRVAQSFGLNNWQIFLKVIIRLLND